MEKLFAVFVENTLLKGRLSQIMLRYRYIFVWLALVLLNFNSKSVYPLSLLAFSYWCLDKLKTSLEEFLHKCSLIVFGNWLIICGGWFEDSLMYDNNSFGFSYGLYVPLFKLSVMYKKSTIFRLVLRRWQSQYRDVVLQIVKYYREWFLWWIDKTL